MNKHLARNLKLRIGTNLRDQGILVNVSRVIMHPRFSATDRFNSDIALIKTSKALKFKHNVKPICLPSLTYSEPKAKSLLVAGWGAMQFTDKTYPVQLRQVTLPIISLENCFDKFGGKGESGINVFKSQICTWAKGKDACRVIIRF